MVRSVAKSTSIKFIIWTFFLQTLMVTALPQRNSSQAIRFLRTPLNTRSLYEQYTLGQQEDGAKIIYTYQYTQTFDEEQQEISIDFRYPDTTGDSDSHDEVEDNARVIITQLQLYVKAEDGANTQAYIIEGGIGDDNIHLQIMANNSNFLNYMLIIYGRTE